MNKAKPVLLLRSAWPPRRVIGMATLFFLVCLTLQCWRLVSLSATYDQALFVQELWSTAQGRPFESSLSSVLSGAVAVGDALPSVSYLHLGQHANALTLIGAPLVAWLGPWALPLLQVSALTLAGLVFWQLAVSRLPAALAERLTAAYFLSGAVIGPALENFHDLIWLPLLGFLVLGGLLERRVWQVLVCGLLLLLVREDSGLLLFSLGLWALVRQPGATLNVHVLSFLGLMSLNRTEETRGADWTKNAAHATKHSKGGGGGGGEELPSPPSSFSLTTCQALSSICSKGPLVNSGPQPTALKKTA